MAAPLAGRTIATRRDVLCRWICGCRTVGSDGVLRVAVEYARHGNLRDFLRRNRPVIDNVTLSSSSSTTPLQCQQCLNESSLTPACHKIPITSRQLLSFASQAARGMQFLASNKVFFFIIASHLNTVRHPSFCNLFPVNSRHANTNTYTDQLVSMAN